MADCLWINHSRPRPGWYLLDEHERRGHLDTWSRIEEETKASGATHVGRFHVRGQSDAEEAAVWLFPTWEGARRYWSRLLDAGYADWRASDNSIGSREGSR